MSGLHSAPGMESTYNGYSGISLFEERLSQMRQPFILILKVFVVSAAMFSSDPEDLPGLSHALKVYRFLEEILKLAKTNI